MASRITDNDLDRLAHQLNLTTGSPTLPYIWDEARGRNVAQVGNFHISHAYGGVCLHRMSNESGGVSTPLIAYHTPKRELFNAMHAFLAGLEMQK